MGRGRSLMPLTTGPGQAEGWVRPLPPLSLPCTPPLNVLHSLIQAEQTPALRELAFPGGDREYTGGVNDQEEKGPRGVRSEWGRGLCNPKEEGGISPSG